MTLEDMKILITKDEAEILLVHLGDLDWLIKYPIDFQMRIWKVWQKLREGVNRIEGIERQFEERKAEV